uniref:DNA-dependent protein kinase catalytic subunit-like n=1 Tax=Styela clava TaxID=7725 RepID=UPI00193A4BEB|nr:DNA-dependent protein kinase catalytic subunit-like [Styela clava]
MADLLRRTLEDLQTTIQDNRVVEANYFINDLRSACFTSSSSSKIGLFCSLIFKGSKSLLNFIKKINHLPVFGKCKEKCLVFIQELVPFVGDELHPFIEDITSICLSVIQAGKLSSNKEKALCIVIKLIDLHHDAPQAKAIRVDNVRKVCNEELAKRSGTTSTVKGNCYHLLGVLAQYFPGQMMNHSERLFDLYLRELKKEMLSTRSSDFKIIEGSLKGLSCLMINFTKSIDEDADVCKEIYKYTLMSIQPKTDLSRYAVPLAGLQVLQKHASQFGHLLTDNYDVIYTALQKWFTHNNNQVKHEAQLAITSFLQQIIQNVTEGLNAEQAKRLFIYFINKFQEMIDIPNASSKMISLAIQGYGLFAGLCKEYMPPGDVAKMFTMMIGRCERIYLGEADALRQTEIDDNQLHQLPSFLQSLANIVREMNNEATANSENPSQNTNFIISESCERSLSHLCILMISEYPRLNKKFSKSCCASLLALMSAFSTCPDAQFRFVSKIVYQGLIRCCCHQVVLGDDRDDSNTISLNQDNVQDIITDRRSLSYRDYLNLWKGLICLRQGDTLASLSIVENRSKRRTVQELVYNEIISSIITIFSKLNLTPKTSMDDLQAQISANQVVENASAENVVDFQVFVNLTDLCRELLPTVTMSDDGKEITQHVFLSRVSELIKELIKHSTRYPIVSGFYKLLAIVMDICESLGYFKSPGNTSVNVDAMDVDGENDLNSERNQNQILIKKFVLEIISRLLQWKNDLLASCLLFILSLPSEIVVYMLDEIVLPLQITFRLGLSYTQLAEAGLNAMEKWKKQLSDKLINKISPVLPDIEPFLHPMAKQSLSDVSSVNLKKSGKSKISNLPLKSDVSALEKIQIRAIKFIGSIGGLAHTGLKSVTEESNSNLIVWDKNATIPYAVPFQELKTDIQLELLLPRVADLASQSVVRRTKVAACEVLHSMTIYAIGRNSQQDETIQKRNPLTGVYEHIFPIILKLACDVEQVSKQLFEPLSMQMIHWFTNNRKYESPDTAVLLNSIINGLIDDSDGALREFCGRAINEFLVWSIKQNSSMNIARKNVKSLFKRLYDLARHPSASKRLGSATAFNHLYRVFREHETLVDEFTFEIMVTYIDSLAMSHRDEEAIGTRKACSDVLNHLKRIVVEKKDLFNKESKIRRIPSGFSSTTSLTIASIVDWLIKQCGCPETECRHQCMQLFYAFVPLVPGSLSAGQWMTKYLKNKGSDALIACFESKFRSDFHPQTLKCEKGNNPLKTASNWFDVVLASLDCYTWIFQQKLLTPNLAFGDNSSRLFECINYILHDVAKGGISEVSTEPDIFTPREHEIFNEKKCTVLVRILQFTHLLLQQYPEDCFKVFPQSFWKSQTLFGTVASCVVNPLMLGFNIESDIKIAEQLPVLTSDIISSLNKKLSGEMKQEFINQLQKEICNDGSLIDQITPLFESSKQFSKIHLVNAYCVLQKSGVLADVLAKTKISSALSLAKEIVYLVFNSLVEKNFEEGSQSTMMLPAISQSTIKLGNSLLDLSFNIGVSADMLVQFMMNETSLYSDTGVLLLTKHGQVFFSTYKSSIIREICSKSPTYIPMLCKHCRKSKVTCANILSEVLEHLFTNRSFRKKYSADLCKNILAEWDDSLSCLWKSSNSETECSAALDIFIKIVTLDSTVCIDPQSSAYVAVYEMVCHFLKSMTLPLSFKTKVLTLLNFFVKSEDSKRQSELKSVISDFCSLHFPSRSSEFTKGTYEYDNYIAALRKFFLCLELTGSAVVLEVIIGVMCKEEQHVLEEEFQSSLRKCFSNVDERFQKPILDVPYKVFSDAESFYPVAFRCRTIDCVLVSMMSQCSSNATNEFFTDHIGNIMQYLVEDIQRYVKEKWKDQLAMKSCCYKLIEIMFSNLQSDVIKNESSPLVQSFAASSVGAGSTKLLKLFMGRVIRDKNEDMTGETELLEERRKFHCCVYNAVIAAVICTQNDIKWFDAFLFSDNPKKKEFLFDNLIDKNKNYVFPVESDEPVEKTKKFVSIRRSNRDIAKLQNPENQSVAYISLLAGSSLSEDVNPFDNNLSSTLTERPTVMESIESNETWTENIVTLENDELNDHECMANIISLIMHMHKNAIGFPKVDTELKSNSSTLPLPKWLNILISKLSSSPHNNVKLFIAKLVINCEHIFEPFASHLIAPMLKAVLSHFKHENKAGDANLGMDQFVVDAVATMLSWSRTAIPKDDIEEKILTRALIENLLKNIRHENRSVFRRNLEVLKTTIECWRIRVSDINTDIIFHQCASTDIKSNDNFPGLQVLGVLLANDLPPYTPSIEVDRNVFFRRIFNNILSARKEIVDTTSEVIGMSLKHLAENQKEVEGEIHDIATGILDKLASSSKSGVSGFGIFIDVLLRVSRHHPPAAKPFFSRVLFNLPKLPGTEMKTKCIDILCLNVDEINGLLAELKAKDFIKMLVHRDESLQHSCLKLCSALVHKSITWDNNMNKMNNEDMIYHKQLVDYFFPSVEKHFQFHPSPLCRQEMYDLAMQIYDIQNRFPTEHQSSNTIKTAKIILLRGLNDTEVFLRTQVINFWSEENVGSHQVRLAADPSGKINGLLGELYQNEVDEAGFLASSCNLLLQAASRSPDFERAIFEHPLSECVFQDVIVDHTWQHRHSTMNPMFVETISSSFGGSPTLSNSAANQQPNALRATQVEAQFSATVDMTGKNTYDWISNSSVDTFSTLNMAGVVSSADNKESAILTNRRQNRHRRKPVGQDFGISNLKSPIEEADDMHIDIARLRRKFQKKSSTDNYHFARVVQQKNRRKQEVIKREKAKRQHSVQLYRTYRAGELPDIQIHHRSLIAPLAALAHLDLFVSQRLLSSLVHAVIEEQSKKSTEYIKQIAETLGNVLASSEQCNPAFIAFILDIIQRNAASIKINPSIVAHAAIKSNQHYYGVRVIEEWLLSQQEPEEPSSKRRKMLQKSSDVNEADVVSWIELARLYRKDLDVLRGIFTGTPVARSLFGNAVEYETQYDYTQATRVYQKALIEDLEPEPSDVEKDLWEDCLLNCLMKLGKWEEVNNFCDNQCDNSLENSWTNKYFQQRFLPTSLHAKMLLLLDGSSECKSELLNFVENAIKHGGDRKQLIESRHSDHVAMLYLHQEDYSQASYYLQKAMDSFAEEWSLSDVQTDILNKAVHLSDMADFIDIMQKHQGKQLPETDVNDLVDKWKTCLPHPIHDSINVWKDMVAHRSYFIDQLLIKYCSFAEESSQDELMLSAACMKGSLARKKLSLLLKSVDVACSQKHFSIARKFLNEDVENVMSYIHSIDGKDEMSLEIMQQSQTLAMYYMKFASHVFTISNKQADHAKASKAILQATKVLVEEIEKKNTDHENLAKLYMFLGQGCSLASDIADINRENDAVFRNILKVLTDANTSETKLVKEGILKDDLRYYAQKSLEKAVDICSESTERHDAASETYFEFAKYCDKVLQEIDENHGQENLTFSDYNAHAKNMVKYILMSMRYNDGNIGQEAALRFPRLLQLVNHYSDDVKTCFLQESSQVPTWMFLRWTNQMIALLDKTEAESVHDIISKLSEEYPQAVIYSVKTSAPDFIFERNELGKTNRDFVKRLQQMLDTSVPLVEPFIKNLTMLSSPAHIFKEWQEETTHILKSKEKGKQKTIFTKYQNMYNEILACGQSIKMEEDDELYGTTSNSASVGSYKINFAKKFLKKVEKAFGGSTGGQGLMNEKKFVTESKNLLTEMNDYCKTQRPQTLKEYSKWLADFSSLNLGGTELEIPGQYNGNSKPISEHHVKISGFGDYVRVMSSLQQPKRITIKASDSHEYQYLVKGNEDLRQDQRIQQIFTSINSILQRDSNCSKRKLFINTYEVIPVTSRLGLIQWVKDTETLQDIIYEEAKYLNKSSLMDKPSQIYSKWLSKFAKGGDVRKMYGEMVKLGNYTEASNKYTEVVHQIPQGLLRNAYLRLSSSPQSFLTLRKKFATSYGALCISHWILGIGDRHTSNCMISTKTGAPVGIDFGHAFGTATEGLPIPELVPFRLSPQICYLMAPHPAKHGELRQSMVFCMSALRSEKETILTMLDVFLKEPSVDWMKYANKVVRVHGSGVTNVDYSGGSSGSAGYASSALSSGSDAKQWYPLRKISIVRRKLSGCKPSKITQDELQHNYQVPKNYLPHFSALADGLPNKNFRSAFNEENLTVGDQVDCLIDQATDPNILVRTYIGWRFWM